MRIIAGQWAGRELVSPGRRVRPTAEAVRAAALDWVARDLPDARVLDLFAGTGALGLEALSRGAARADFVERNPAALHALKANVARFRLKGRVRIFKKDVLEFLAGAGRGAYDLALVDPPYTSALSERVVERWLEHPFSRVLLVECAKDRALPGTHKRRVLGDTALALYVNRRARPKASG
jgi:16S rRNA (guanine966-N2)-methyltransferase